MLTSFLDGKALKMIKLALLTETWTAEEEVWSRHGGTRRADGTDGARDSPSVIDVLSSCPVYIYMYIHVDNVPGSYKSLHPLVVGR